MRKYPAKVNGKAREECVQLTGLGVRLLWFEIQPAPSQSSTPGTGHLPDNQSLWEKVLGGEGWTIEGISIFTVKFMNRFGEDIMNDAECGPQFSNRCFCSCNMT